jgi:hypothetical protein
MPGYLRVIGNLSDSAVRGHVVVGPIARPDLIGVVNDLIESGPFGTV